jgi:putative oxidoreductase
MKIAVLVSRIILGLVFVVFGFNGFLQFLHMPMPTGLPAQFMGALYESHYYIVIFAAQIIGGALLLSGYYVSLGLTILGPLLVNILTFHATMAPAGLPMAILWTILWFIVFIGYRQAFAGILTPKAPLP